mmetsp:Transcript_18403/g.29983  ORF Transcript_18403/g.29983 Transcript_18403/m.29983 type:complete len:740 (-) Transcript_18403:376-2595(-)
MAKKQGMEGFTPDEYYRLLSSRRAGNHNHQPYENSNRHNRHQDRLFHLQQELLRQELPQKQWSEIQQHQSQRLEQLLQQEELMWQRRRHQARQSATLRESMTSESERGMENSEGRGKMGGSFNLDNRYPNDGTLCSPFMKSDTPLCLPAERTPRKDHNDNMSCSSRGQLQYSNDRKTDLLPIHHSRSTGSILTSSHPFDYFPRRSYHDEPSIQPHTQQLYVNALPYSRNLSPNNLPFQSYGRGEGEAAYAAATSSAVQNTSLNPKRRRLNFYDVDSTSTEKLMLEMLNDTVVSPTITKVVHGQSLLASSSSNNDSSNDASDNEATLMDGGLLSPFSNYIKPTLHHEDVSLSPLTQTKGGGFTGSTPRMFADFFLGNRDGDGLDVSTMPPPPLVHNNIDSNNKNGSDGSNVHSEETPLKGGVTTDVSLLSPACDSLDSLPLPPRNLQQRDAQHGKKKPSRTKSQKKSKDGTFSSVPTCNHIITPSSATITALSAEIRSKVQSSSSPQDRDVVNNAHSPGNDSRNGDAFSAPNFASTMEASQASQQAIHDWDRKFGLRRAHSKTMRESCRSRKRVLEFLKGEGANILLLKKSISTRETPRLRASRTSTSVSLPLSQEEEKERGAVQELDNADAIVHHAKPKLEVNEEMGSIVQVNREPSQQVQQESRSSSSHSSILSQCNDGDIGYKDISEYIPDYRADNVIECASSVNNQSYDSEEGHESGKKSGRTIGTNVSKGVIGLS